MDIFQILTSSLIPTLIVSLLTLYLTERLKASIKNNFDAKLENVKKEHNLELAKFQTELNHLKSKENFKFTKLHEKRFVILEDIYKLLNEALSKLNYYIAPAKILPNGMQYLENEDKLEQEFVDSHNKFVKYFQDNKIYLTESVIELIENYIKDVQEIFSDYNENHLIRKLTEQTDREIWQKAFQAYKKVPDKLIPVKKEIEKNFRKLLEE